MMPLFKDIHNSSINILSLGKRVIFFEDNYSSIDNLCHLINDDILYSSIISLFSFETIYSSLII